MGGCCRTVYIAVQKAAGRVHWLKVVLQDCNFVLYNGNYTTKAPSSGFTAFATGTNGRGSGFCRAVVSSTNGGTFQVCSGSRAAQMWFSHP